MGVGSGADRSRSHSSGVKVATRSWGVECVDESDPHAFGRAAAEVGLANAIVVAQRCAGPAGNN